MERATEIHLDDPRDFERWQQFVHARSETHCTDLAEWRHLFGELYRIRSHNFAVTGGNELRGVMSLYHIRSPFLGNMLVTSPFFGYGGLHWDSEAVRDALLEKAEEVARRLGVDYIELRLRQALPEPYRANTDFLEFDIELPPTPEAAWNDALASNVRQNIRRSRKHDLRFSVSADYRACYRLLCRTLRAHGTPFHGERFFRLLVRHLADRVRFTEVHHGDDLIAAGVIVRFRDGIQTPYIGSLGEFRHLRANYCQYWGIVEWCYREGVTRFELGRSPKGSTHDKFKRKWGGKQMPIYYNYRVINPRKPYRSVSQPGRMELLATRVWRRLPLAVTRTVGPRLFRYIP